MSAPIYLQREGKRKTGPKPMEPWKKKGQVSLSLTPLQTYVLERVGPTRSDAASNMLDEKAKQLGITPEDEGFQKWLAEVGIFKEQPAEILGGEATP